MKATINRIAILVAVLLPSLASAQSFPASVYQSKKLPGGHPKLAQQSQQIGQAAEVVSPAAIYPTCAFDEMNAAHCLEDPNFEEELHHHLEGLPLLSAGSAAKSAVIEPLLTISVVVHVIHNGEPVGTGQNLSDAQIQAQIAVLNEDFTALNSQFYNTPSQWMGIAGFPNIQFCLANKKPDGTPTNGIDRQQLTVTGSSWNNNNINSSIKPAIRWNPLRYFNIYVLPIPGTTAQGGVVGFSNYPVTGQVGGNSDGVVIDYRWFGAPGFGQSGYRPLTHETGHYLGLPHTFNGSSCTIDDGIADTPDINASTRDLITLNCEESYPNGPVSCGNEHLYVNYMDYVTENCYTSFTAGQVNVMRAVLNGTSSGFGYGSRQMLIQNAPQQCSIPAKDAGITRLVSPQNVSCSTSGQFTPMVTLRNFGTETLTSTTIFYQINNAAPTSFAWQGSLFAGQNLDVNLAPFSVGNGNYSFKAWTSQPNGQLDQRLNNDTISANRFNYLSAAPPTFEDFEGETGLPTSVGIFQLNVSNDAFVWQVSDEASAFGAGGTSVMFDNFNDINGQNPLGTIDALITRHFDFTNVNDAVLKFDVAYAPYIEDVGDSLLVLVATNCSQNFNQIVYRKGGMELSTSPIVADAFTPTASQWRTDYVDLSNYDGMSDVTIALVNKSAFGNRLFLDNIGIGRSCNQLTATATNILPDDCSQACNGSATILASSPNGGLRYTWEGFPSSFNQATNSQLCVGTNSVTVTDAIGCKTELELTVPGDQAPQLTTTTTPVTTFGVNNGTATVTVTGGTAPYSYLWSNGFQQNGTSNTNSTASNLVPGFYTVTVTASNGCTVTESALVGSVCTGFAITTNSVVQPCFQGSNGSLSASIQNGTPPFAFAWSNGQTSLTATNLTAGTYSLTATDANGCPASTTSNLVALPAISLSITPTHQTLNNVNNGVATANAGGGSGPFSYFWSNGVGGNPITGLAPGNYTVTVTDASGCTSSATTVINSVSCGAFSGSLAVENLDCFGVNNGSATANMSGGNAPLSYAWSNGSTTSQATNLPAGPIAVTVTDALGCGSQLSGNITQPTALAANLTATDETLLGANDGSANANPSGGTSPYTVLWGNGSNALTISGLAPNTYAVTVTDGNGCTTFGQVVVGTSTCFITIQTSTIPTSCPDFANGSATVNIQSGGVGPFGFLWSNGETTQTISGITSGSYLVTVTDAAGCSETGQATVSSNDTTPPTINLVGSLTIELGLDGTATIDPNDLVVSTVDNCSMLSLEAFPATVSCADLGSSMVTLTATDNSGNEAIGVTVLSVVDQLAPSITCPSDIIVADCAPVTYAMPTAADNCGSNIELELVAGLASGQQFPAGITTVIWSATDASGNASTCSFDVNVNNSISVATVVQDPSCHGFSDGFIDLQISGGQAPYQVDWNDPDAPDNLPAGTYTASIVDNNGCLSEISVELTEPDELLITPGTITPATTGQSNGQIGFSINGGTAPYTLTWLQGGVPVPGFDPLAAAAGSYQLKVEDANGCLKLSGLLVVGSVTSTAETELEQRIRIAPNPSTGLFYLTTDGLGMESLQVTVFDATGRLLVQPRTLNRISTAEIIDLQSFSPGVFWLKIMAGEAVVWKKLVRI